MSLVNLVNGEKPVHLVLAKDRVRSIKRGSPWVFADALRDLPKAPAGSLALLKTPDGDIISKGYYGALPWSCMHMAAWLLSACGAIS